MRALTYLGFKQIKNYLKNNLPMSIFIAFCMGLWIFGIFINGTTTDYFFSGKGAMEIHGFIFILAIIAILLSFFQANSLLISKADASILFLPPIKPHKTLLSIFAKSSSQIVLFIIMFAYLNTSVIVPFFHLAGMEIVYLYLVELLIILTLVTTGMLMLLIRNKNIILFRIIETASFLGAIAIVFFYVLNLAEYLGFSITGGGDLITFLNNFDFSLLKEVPSTFNNYFTQTGFQFIPVVGLFISASKIITTPDMATYLSIGGILLLNILFLMSPYYIKVNMAEPAFEIAERNLKRFKRKRKGNTIEVTNKVKTSIPIKISGVWAIVSKQMIDYKRTSKFFMSGSVLTTGLILAIYLISLKFISFTVVQGTGTDEAFVMIEQILAYSYIGITFFISILLVSPLQKDISSPIVYLIPDNAYKKIMAVSIITHFEHFVRSALIFIFAYYSHTGFGFSLAVSIIFFLTMSICGFVDMFSYSIFSDGDSGILRGLLAGFFKILIMLAIITVYGLFVFFGFRDSGVFSFLSVFGLIVCGLITLIGNVVFVWLAEGVVSGSGK